MSKEVTLLTYKEIVKLLKANGWYNTSSRGSHFYFEHDNLPGKITIPKHRRRCQKECFTFNIKTGKNKCGIGVIFVKLAYPACFYEEKVGYSVVFPDLPGCITQGETLEEAMEMAEEAACGWLLLSLERGEELPKSSKINEVKINNKDGKSFVNYVLLDIGSFSEKYSEKKYIKKTLTLPYWLNEIAEKKGINFSKTLQDALLRTTSSKRDGPQSV